MHAWWDTVEGPRVSAPAPVLVVDNDAAKRLAICATLAPLGYRLVEADSGVSALRCLMEGDFAVILLDVRMPMMDGFETASLIRLRPRSEMTPIIFITAYSGDELAADRYAHGAVDFLFTPFEPDELRAKVSVFANLFLRAESLAAQARDVQASADQLRVLTEAAPIGIFQTDAQNRYVYCNPRWAEITGIPFVEAEGQELDVILEPGERAALDSKRMDPTSNGADFSRRFTIAGSNGTPRVVLLTSRSVTSTRGASSGWVGTLADITSVVDAEAALSEARDEAREASRLKSDFLANMSHEIRTPMNGVLGMAELLLETDLDIRQRDYAETVHSSGEALLTVINDILDFSKIETGHLETQHIQLSVSSVVKDVVDLLSNSARSNGLDLITTIEDSVPLMVNGDPGRLRQVLTNLVGNAIKFSENGEIVVRVTAKNVESHPLIHFDVSDTGVGISPDKLTMIFEPFVQEDTSTSRRYGGTGLGLAISSQLVKLMGGEIGVSTTLGVGSTFWFTISTKDPDASTTPTATGLNAAAGPETSTAQVDGGEPAEPAHPAEVIAPSRAQKERLLVAEDNVVNRKVAVAMLTSAGYQVDTARNGLEAVQATLLQDYDAILMDIQMPELSGYEATEAIRAREGSRRHTPIIALTAGARAQDRELCMAHAMDDYLSKPFSKSGLLGVVRESLRTTVVTGSA